MASLPSGVAAVITAVRADGGATMPDAGGRLEATPLKEVAEWAENYRRFWRESYERLDAYLQHLKEKGVES